MVSNTGRTSDTRRIRRLKQPQSIETETDGEATPVRLKLAGRWCDVVAEGRPWRIDQHWWRGEAVSRMYYRVALEDGPPLTIYHDFNSDKWFRQEYK
jgi:hypothetical protein